VAVGDVVNPPWLSISWLLPLAGAARAAGGRQTLTAAATD
jgi:hypothetical protein